MTTDKSTRREQACRHEPPAQNAAVNAIERSSDRWMLVSYSFEGGDKLTSPPRVALEFEDLSGRTRFQSAAGPCQLDAFIRCAEEITRHTLTVRSYDSRTVWCKAGGWTEGTLTIDNKGEIVKAYGCGANAMHAFVVALVRALNILAS